MKVAVIAFSNTGGDLAEKLPAGLEKNRGQKSDQGQDLQLSLYIAERHYGELREQKFLPFESVYDLTAELFDQMDALIFIGAAGIAVRAIAPHVKSKLTDPAVIVCDEGGTFAISLLSGHVGGANKLAEEIAQVIGATPVVTTASDIHINMEDGLRLKNLVLGIGCRRGLAAETIERTATILLWDKKIPLERVSDVASIDVKKDEEGLLIFAKAHELPLHFYSAEELALVDGDFKSSEFVENSVGVDNVCERAAVLCGGSGKLIMGKTARNGVTVAVFERDFERE